MLFFEDSNWHNKMYYTMSWYDQDLTNIEIPQELSQHALLYNKWIIFDNSILILIYCAESKN